MNKLQPTLEHALYALALGLAVSLRFLQLGRLPLSDFEADWALQALRVAQGLKPAIGPNPAYVHLTAISFFIFGATNFLARFWPALAGSVLVLTPLFLRNRIGRIPALLLAFGLAFDPGLVAMSHLAGGPILAITCLVLAGLNWLDGQRLPAGCFAGLALLCGPSVWFGLLGIVFTWAFTSVFGRSLPAQAKEKTDDEETVAVPTQPRPDRIRRLNREEFRGAIAWGLGTLLVVGSLFILSPQGLPAFMMSFVESLRGWWTPSEVPVWRLLLALPAYEILPLGFGLAGAVRGFLKRDTGSICLGIWALVSLVLALIYPGKQTSDLIWTLLPLWVLASIELGHHFDFEGRNRWELAGLITLVITLLVFGWLDLAGVTTMDLSTEQARMRLYLLIAVVFLIGLSLLLVGAGWSANVARLGGVWGGVISLTVFTFAMSTGAAGLREPLTIELWQPVPRSGRVDVLLKVANQISELNTGYNGQLPLTVLGVNSPALQWLFRDWQVQQASALAPDAMPELVISSVDQLSLASDYRGEALPLSEVADWGHNTPSVWLKWFVYRQMPILHQDIILWVRSDLMLDHRIGKADPVCTITAYDVPYDGSAHTATGECLGAKGETLSGLVLTGTTHTVVGDYPGDVWTFTDVTGNYNNDSGTVDDRIGKTDPVCTITAYDVPYDGSAHTATGECLGAKGETLSGLVLTGTTHIGVGDYPGDAWTFTDVTGNYNNDSGIVDYRIYLFPDYPITYLPDPHVYPKHHRH